MRKFVLLSVFICLVCFISGCAKTVNYLDYVSEKRTDIYLYSDDGVEIKVYISEKETPYTSDGIKGEMTKLTEIFVTLPRNYEEVTVSAGNANGDMNYRAVENCYYLSSSDAGISGESVEITLTLGGESNTYNAVNVLYKGVMDCDGAVKCVLDHSPELFSSLTENGVFCGEIYVRLIYDEGCYYYVGICDRNKKIIAHLVDGVRGKIIAVKEIQG